MADPINNRYLVFAGDHYYPEGGITDLIMETDDLEKAKKEAHKHSNEWAHIWDIVTRKTIYAR